MAMEIRLKIYTYMHTYALIYVIVCVFMCAYVCPCACLFKSDVKYSPAFTKKCLSLYLRNLLSVKVSTRKRTVRKKNIW